MCLRFSRAAFRTERCIHTHLRPAFHAERACRYRRAAFRAEFKTFRQHFRALHAFDKPVIAVIIFVIMFVVAAPQSFAGTMLTPFSSETAQYLFKKIHIALRLFLFYIARLSRIFSSIRFTIAAAIGMKDTAIMPTTTSLKFAFTNGMLPKKKPAARNPITQMSPPRTL